MASRNEILGFIKETAKGNDGVPLGVRAFQNQTGIRQAEWRGIYWARWSDAVDEAGLTMKNTFTTRADKSVLLEKFIPAIRYYGKIPTVSESRMYSKTTPGFPSDSTIRNHFPTKIDLIKALVIYIRGKPELEDIASLCKQFDLAEEDTGNLPSSEGHVYLFKSGNHYKIGKTSNLERRVKEITVALPEPLTIIHTIKTDDPDGIEAYWHRRFNDRRANGEWFKLNAADIAAFKRRKFQ